MTLKGRRLFLNGLNELGINYTDKIIEQFSSYIYLYYKWVKKINISSILNEDDIIIRHFLDSISPLVTLRDMGIWNSSSHCVDLGSGGGFPGIPLSILEPNIYLDFAEVNKKKICFLKELILNLPLNGVNIVDSSCSVVNRFYTLLLTRAFGSLKKILRESKKYLTNGYIISYKGRIDKVNSEITDLSLKVRDKLAVKRVIVPFLVEERHIVIINI